MVVKCTNGTAVYPAGSDTGRSCSSIGLSNQNAPAMGQHFVLNMSVAEIEALPDPGWQKTVLRAMAEYGLYVGDTGGGFLKVQSGVSFTSMGMGDPWSSLASRVTTAARAASTTSGLAISPECINFEVSEAVTGAASSRSSRPEHGTCPEHVCKSARDAAGLRRDRPLRRAAALRGAVRRRDRR